MPSILVPPRSMPMRCGRPLMSVTLSEHRRFCHQVAGREAALPAVIAEKQLGTRLDCPLTGWIVRGYHGPRTSSAKLPEVDRSGDGGVCEGEILRWDTPGGGRRIGKHSGDRSRMHRRLGNKLELHGDGARSVPADRSALRRDGDLQLRRCEDVRALW